MKMRIGDYEFEGSPEELLALKRQLESSDDKAMRVGAAGPSEDEHDPEYVSEKVAHLVIVRRPLSREQRILLTTLYEAGKKWTPASELQDQLNYNTSKFAGLMGAFGRRLAYTRGVGRYESFFEQRWDDAAGCNFYRLPPSVRAALERAKVV